MEYKRKLKPLHRCSLHRFSITRVMSLTALCNPARNPQGSHIPTNNQQVFWTSGGQMTQAESRMESVVRKRMEASGDKSSGFRFKDLGFKGLGFRI